MIRTKEKDDEEYVKITTFEEFDAWCREGWDGGAAEFEEDTGVKFEEIKGVYFTVVHGRVYFEEKKRKGVK